MAMTARNSIDQPVHFAVTVRVREGKEAEFADLLVKFAQRSLDYRGTTGVHLIQPVPGSNCREFGILRSFLSERHSQEFYESEMYQQYKLETTDLVDGEPIFRQLNGLEAFFQSGGYRIPPKWKMAAVTYLGVLPSTLLWSSTLRPWLSTYHWVIGAAVGNAAVVATLAWIMMPLLTKAFHRWLHPSAGKL